VSRAEKLKEEERFDVEAVLQHLDVQGVHAYTAESNAALLEKLLANTRAVMEPQVVVFFTNGSFDGIIAAFAQTAGRA